jgi:hypothetical protein
MLIAAGDRLKALHARDRAPVTNVPWCVTPEQRRRRAALGNDPSPPARIAVPTPILRPMPGEGRDQQPGQHSADG